MPISTHAEILTQLDRLDSQTADGLETQWLEQAAKCGTVFLARYIDELALGLPLVSRDGKIRASAVSTVW